MKLLQTVMLCYELKRICEESSKGFNNGRASMQQLGNESHKIPLVLCGDFNSLPESGEFRSISLRCRCCGSPSRSITA